MNKKNNKGETPLELAFNMRDFDIFDCLINESKNIKLENSKGESFLYHACLAGDAEVIEFLLRRGADPYEKNIFGESLLRVVFSRQRLDIANLMLLFMKPQPDFTGYQDGIILSNHLLENRFDIFMKYLSLWTNKVGVLRFLLSNMKIVISNNLGKEDFDADYFKDHKKILTVLTKAILEFGDENFDSLIRFLKKIGRADGDKYLEFMLSIPGLTEKLGDRLNGLKTKFQSEGRAEAVRIVDAALMRKLV